MFNNNSEVETNETLTNLITRVCLTGTVVPMS